MASWPSASGGHDRHAVLAVGLNVEHQATRTTKLLETLLVESGSSDRSVANDIGVRVSMSERLALAFG